ncbi:hypothetical protein [Bacillus sp. cl95]|uniref:hypothetical protein n=2 Tax=unclassified Bacillus (in: firmicutes) TaxID=185979 RepID=UPI0008E4BFCA|nr:hypothetical protein [Bacillus sp. cl95]SFB19577.1 hypothetical protein SAMN02799634_10810 [Bacillus sp. UNCCL13]SFQ90696.1 hypothetical protein SAMN04488577_3826 [Bacillus sp. cl95]
MFLWILLGISLLITVFLIYRSFGLLKIFHWYELIIIFLFIASVNSWCFGLYQSAYETLNIVRKPKEYMIAYIQFVLFFPISLLWIASLIRRKVSLHYIIGFFLIWCTAYVLVFEFDAFFNVLKIKHSHWYPILISFGYNITTIVLTYFFMRFLKGHLIKEGKWNG